MLQHFCWQSVLERVCEIEDDTQKENVIIIKKGKQWEQLKITPQDYKNTAESYL